MKDIIKVINNIGKRKTANEEILSILKEYLENHPEIRFVQALWNLSIIRVNKEKMLNDNYIIIDDFYEEPIDTLKRIRQNEVK